MTALYCERTGYLCGTDPRPAGDYCRCVPCLRWWALAAAEDLDADLGWPLHATAVEAAARLRAIARALGGDA